MSSKADTAPRNEPPQRDDKPTAALSQRVLEVLDMRKMTEEEQNAIWTLIKYLRKEGK